MCRQLIRECLRGRCRIHIAGDLHFYLRHSLAMSQQLPTRVSEPTISGRVDEKVQSKTPTLNKIVSDQKIGGDSVDGIDGLGDSVRS